MIQGIRFYSNYSSLSLRSVVSSNFTLNSDAEIREKLHQINTDHDLGQATVIDSSTTEQVACATLMNTAAAGLAFKKYTAKELEQLNLTSLDYLNSLAALRKLHDIAQNNRWPIPPGCNLPT